MAQVLKDFWVIEGLDGAGTTTQLKMLAKHIEDNGKKVFMTAEPTVNEIGRLIRKVLKGEFVTNQEVTAHLFAADRADHLSNPVYGIRKHIENGEIAITDRYFFSSLAYQSNGCDWDKVASLNADFPYPQYLIFVDTPPDVCMGRIESRGEQKEIFEKLEFQKKVLQGYEKAFRNIPEGCTLIRVDGTLPREQVFQAIISQTKL